MIWFNGSALESIAPVKIVDVVVSPIQMSPTARQRPVQWGAQFVRMTGGSRTATITFSLMTEDLDERQDQIRNITAWATGSPLAKLMLPYRDGVYLMAGCTSLPEPSTRQWWENRLRLVFSTFDDPYWISMYERNASCGSAFTVMGDAPDGPLMRIERTLSASASNQIYGNGTESMTFSSIPAGALVIDLNHQTAAVNGTSIMANYTMGSSFLIPRNGVQTITGTGSIIWRERWQ